MPGNDETFEEELTPREILAQQLGVIGITSGICEFLADISESETELNLAVFSLLRRTREDEELVPPHQLKEVFSDAKQLFLTWQQNVNRKVVQGEHLKHENFLELNKFLALKSVKARSALKFNQFVLKKGDEVFVTQAQNGNFSLRNSEGQVQDVHGISIISPCPYNSVTEAITGLQLQLFTLWRGIVKQLRILLSQSIQLVIHPPHSSSEENEFNKEELSVLESALDNNNMSDVDWIQVNDAIALLLQSSKCKINKSTRIDIDAINEMIAIQNLIEEDSQKYREELNNLYQSTLLRIADKSQVSSKANRKRLIKFQEFRTTLQRNTTTEEITYFEGSTNGNGHSDKITADQVTSTSKEVRQSLVIRAVIDPRSGQEISLGEAMANGVVEMASGSYRNPDTGETIMSLAEAMSHGKVLVEQQRESVTEETVQAMGIIEIQSLLDNRPYTIDKVFDAERGEKVSLEDANKRKLIDVDAGIFVQSSTGDKIPLFDAIQEGWVLVTYATDAEPQYQKVTYAVTYVVDQKEKRKVPFLDAVEKGLIDKATGNYFHNVDNETVHVKEALRRGFLKAKVVDNDSDQLSVDLENHEVTANVNKVRDNVVKMAATMKAFSRATAGKK